MTPKKCLYIIVGCIGLILGAIGVVVPLMPAFPFLLLATYCFARGSDRLHHWFLSTRLYKNNLQSYVQGQGMTPAAKRRIMMTVTILIAISMAILHWHDLTWVILLLAAIWLFHILYFTLAVKTLRVGEK